MDRHDITEQVQVEHDLLKHVMEALRISTGWQVRGTDASRKLSTVQFVTASFQRHLDRLLALEEYDGYLASLVGAAPHLARAAAALRAEHDQFRKEARALASRLEGLSPSDLAGLEKACTDLLDLVRRIEEHNREELELMQEALERDEGGEG